MSGDTMRTAMMLGARERRDRDDSLVSGSGGVTDELGSRASLDFLLKVTVSLIQRGLSQKKEILNLQ